MIASGSYVANPQRSELFLNTIVVFNADDFAANM